MSDLFRGLRWYAMLPLSLVPGCSVMYSFGIENAMRENVEVTLEFQDALGVDQWHRRGFPRTGTAEELLAGRGAASKCREEDSAFICPLSSGGILLVDTCLNDRQRCVRDVVRLRLKSADRGVFVESRDPRKLFRNTGRGIHLFRLTEEPAGTRE